MREHRDDTGRRVASGAGDGQHGGQRSAALLVYDDKDFARVDLRVEAVSGVTVLIGVLEQTGGMDLFVDALPPGLNRVATIVTLLISVFVCAILCWFCFKAARQLWEYDDVTMTPPYFKTWPSAASIAIGYGLLAGRMFVQVLGEIDPRRFAGDLDESERGLHRAE